MASSNSPAKFNPRHVTYAYGKVAEAVYALATGAGDIKERLLGASDPFWAVHPNMVPPDVSSHIVWIREQLTRFAPVGKEGAVQATIRRIHRSTGVKIAERIVLVQALLDSHR